MEKNTPIPKGFLKHPVHLLALGFGTGCSPKMPGTIGTLVGVIFYLGMMKLSMPIYVAITVVLFLLGIYLCEKAAKDLNVHDHGGIVWDEIVGFLITMIAVPPDWRFILLGFVLFRLFDIWKPWPIRWLDRKVSGGFGIMIDDMIAGIFALIILQIIIYLL